jgi:hypothetical protein
VTEEPFRDLLRIREGAVLVGVVRLEHHLVDTDAVEQRDPHRVLEEAAVDVLLVVVRRRLRNPLLPLGPLVGVPGVVRALYEIANPADLAFRIQELQPRELLEFSREDPVDHRGHAVARDQVGREA